MIHLLPAQSPANIAHLKPLTLRRGELIQSLARAIRPRSIDSSSLAELQSFPPVLARVYAARGVSSVSELDYKLSRLAQPSSMKGLSAAHVLLYGALVAQQRVLIVGDFDCDGATSTAVAVRCLQALGFNSVDFLVPNRFEYGYGLTPEIVEVAAGFTPDLLITVDNGISSIEGVQRAKEKGIKVLVTDHHLPGNTLPCADAIVNPNQVGCEFLSKNAAGVGVIFYVLSSFRSFLREKGWFEARPEPNLAEFLDLVALGTVADVVPLDQNNRVFVHQGLNRIRAGKVCPGIEAIVSVAGRSIRELSSTDLGFVVGPRLNAAGRLDDMTVGIRCLLTDDHAEAAELAQELDALNKDRRSIEGLMQKEALTFLDELSEDLNNEFPAGVCLHHSEWHQGVIGILASRIKDRLHRPVIIFADDDQGGLKGSGRSIAGIHLRDVLDEVATKNPGMLTKFGGHAMAAGLSLDKDKLEAFQRSFAEVVARLAGSDGLDQVFLSDGALKPPEVHLDLAKAIERAGPWGQAFPEPVFDGEFYLVQQRIVGKNHLKMVLSIDQSGAVYDAIAFNIDTALWPNEACKKIRALYKLSINRFRGKESVQLMVDQFEAC